MKKFELKVTFKDWLFINFIAILFSLLVTSIIYISLNLNLYSGLITGAVLGFCLALFSFSLISINNKYILPHIKNSVLWWIISALFAFLAGFFGFYFAYFIIRALSINLPQILRTKIHIFALFVGLINYLIGLIIYLFINMRSKKTELESLITEGRLLSLNTQLNSHFLFNVLNNITELITINKDMAEKALLNLSRFLRKVFKEGDLVSVSEELENVKTYVELENLRYENLIRLEITGDTHILDFLIPKFSIQLIVENAIKHGFTGKELNIKVHFENLKNFLKIHIKNDGKPVGEMKFGIGLTNLSRRINLLCKGKIEYREVDNPEFIISLPK